MGLKGMLRDGSDSMDQMASFYIGRKMIKGLKNIIFGLDKAGESLNGEVSREDTMEEEPCRRERVNVNGR